MRQLKLLLLNILITLAFIAIGLVLITEMSYTPKSEPVLEEYKQDAPQYIMTPNKEV